MTTAHLRILETTDLHMHLLGFDYANARQTHAFGLANLAPVISKARQGPDLTLLFDNGDFLQGNPLAEYIVTQGDPAGVHPAINAMHALSYDAITLGNHEFDYGLDYLLSVLARAKMPVVCANLRASPHKTLLAPWTILTRDILCADGETHEIRIGVIGFVTPQIVDWDAHLLAGRIMTDDIVAAARSYLPQLRRAGADIIVALCHSGISAQPYHHRMENVALPLAALPGIDVVLAGHTHDYFPAAKFDGIAGIDATAGTLHGKPAVMAGAYGTTLGIIDLFLRWEPDGWQVETHKVSLEHPKPPLEGQPDAVAALIADDLATPHLATLDKLRISVTTTPRRLTSYLAALGQDDTAGLLAAAQIACVRTGLHGTSFAELPIIASTASFRAGGHGGPDNFIDLPKGPLTLGDVSAIAPFDNPVCGILMRGWQVRQWLEQTSAFFAVLDETDALQDLLNPQIAPYHFDTIHGLRYRIDLRVPPRMSDPGAGLRNRVRDVFFNGLPLQDDDLFVVATSSYRAYGGGGQIDISHDDVIFTSDIGLTTILAAHLRKTGVALVSPPCPWSFVPFQNANLAFTTSPRVRDLMAGRDDLNALRLLDSNADGFQLVALRL